MSSNPDVEADLSILRGQMIDLLRQINALPGVKNQGKRKVLWQRFKVYAAEAKALDVWRVDRNHADL